ncbi:lipocalin family protein [uncultured Microbacterium sp.]|uniref:lipocalin family protein n=1 Tax=uncultured Microbacterium sp. TaxID=191216 RepID=UPI00261F0292|nr:lipocalin family protein [uncultured Microbacterium sp.]
MSEDNNVRSVESLDLERYLGLWYEIGRLPLRYEDDAATNVTAEYSLNDDGTVTVDNRCHDEDGKPTQALGHAVPDEEHPGRLQVTFLPEGLRWIPFTKADYWVLRIDPEYRHALVGTPDHKYLWLLSREPHMDAARKTDYLATAQEQGYALDSWIEAGQSGRRVEV